MITYFDNLFSTFELTNLSCLLFPENNEFGEVKPTPVLKNNHQGKLKPNLHIFQTHIFLHNCVKNTFNDIVI